jgi:hypothetical protein
MARLNIVLSDETEHRLRRTLVDLPDYGGRKGDLSQAIEEAIIEWLDENDKKRKDRK